MNSNTVFAINQLTQLRNRQYNENQIRESISKIEKLNSIEMMAIKELINQLKNYIFDDQEKEQFLQDILEMIQDKFSLNQAIQNTNNFIEYKNQCNNNNIGIAILNQNGQFILTDSYARNILEIGTKEAQSQYTLFGLICQASEQKLKKIYTNNCILQNGRGKDSFYITIYSDRNRKKSLKYLSQIAQEPIKKKIKKIKEQSIILRQNESLLSKEQVLIAKYLKSLQINMNRCNLKLGNGFIQAFQESEDIILTNLNINNIQSINQVVVCEIKEVEDVEVFTYQELISDPYIAKHEVKWQNKIKKYLGCATDEEEL